MSTVDDIVRIRIAEAARKIAAAKTRRARQQEARNHGLTARHRAKLRHLQQAEQQSEQPPPDAA
jgi:hypothetical protein